MVLLNTLVAVTARRILRNKFAFMTAASFFVMAALISGIFTLTSFAWTNISYAQLLQPGTGHALLSLSQNKQVLPNANLSQNIQHIKNAVKITSPSKHQQIPIDKNLIITGTSISVYYCMRVYYRVP